MSKLEELLEELKRKGRDLNQDQIMSHLKMKEVLDNPNNMRITTQTMTQRKKMKMTMKVRTLQIHFRVVQAQKLEENPVKLSS